MHDRLVLRDLSPRQSVPSIVRNSATRASLKFSGKPEAATRHVPRAASISELFAQPDIPWGRTRRAQVISHLTGLVCRLRFWHRYPVLEKIPVSPRVSRRPPRSRSTRAESSDSIDPIDLWIVARGPRREIFLDDLRFVGVSCQFDLEESSGLLVNWVCCLSYSVLLAWLNLSFAESLLRLRAVCEALS